MTDLEKEVTAILEDFQRSLQPLPATMEKIMAIIKPLQDWETATMKFFEDGLECLHPGEPCPDVGPVPMPCLDCIKKYIKEELP